MKRLAYKALRQILILCWIVNIDPWRDFGGLSFELGVFGGLEHQIPGALESFACTAGKAPVLAT